MTPEECPPRGQNPYLIKEDQYKWGPYMEDCGGVPGGQDCAARRLGGGPEGRGGVQEQLYFILVLLCFVQAYKMPFVLVYFVLTDQKPKTIWFLGGALARLHIM